MASVPAPLLLNLLCPGAMHARAAWFTGRVSWPGAPLLASTFWLRLARRNYVSFGYVISIADNGDRCGAGGIGAAVPLGPKTSFFESVL